jgi:hypothetical protein
MTDGLESSDQVADNGRREELGLVGDLVLSYEALELAGDSGQRILAYTAEPGSPTRHALDLLASWVSTPDGAIETVDDRLMEQ